MLLRHPANAFLDLAVIQIYQVLSKLLVTLDSVGEQAPIESKVYDFNLKACALLKVFRTNQRLVLSLLSSIQFFVSLARFARAPKHNFKAITGSKILLSLVAFSIGLIKPLVRRRFQLQ